MDRLLMFLIGLAMMVSSAQAQSPISESLAKKLAAENDWQPVYIVPKDYGSAKIHAEKAVSQIIGTLQHQAGLSQRDIRTWLAQNSQWVSASSISYYWVANVITAYLHPEGIRALAKHSNVEAIIPISPLYSDRVSRDSPLDFKIEDGHEPNHDAIHAPELWKLGYTGYGRKVLIIDSGVDGTHPALKDNYWGNYVPPSHAWYHPDGNPLPTACDIHGTHVTGIATGFDRTENDTLGVAFEALWMAAPAVPTTNGQNCNAPLVPVLSALQWALNPDGDTATTTDMPDVINNSWAISDPAPGNECMSIFETVFENIEAAGIAIVFSAGNEGPGVSSIPSPKNISTSPVNTFCVGSVYHQNPSFPAHNSSSRGPALCGGLTDNLFKPEVVAPGVNIRSCGLNHTYVPLSGTSMAAPHVSGALLLLKQAFPFLSGTDLKYALYESAIDLGDPGEDNVYGQGIIHVQAAFDTLLAQGHIPAPPAGDLDLALLEIDGLSDWLCDTEINGQIKVQNQGVLEIDSLILALWVDGIQIDSLIWYGNLAPNDSLLIPFNLSLLQDGFYDLLVEVTVLNGLEDRRFLNNQLSFSFQIQSATHPQAMGDTACLDSETILKGEGTPLYWFESAQSLSPFDSGGQVLSPPMSSAQTFYAALGLKDTLGKKDNMMDMGDFNTSNAWLIFDALHPFRLKSVKVYSEADGVRKFELRDALGNVITEKSVFFNIGERRVELDLDVPKGAGLQLGIGDNGQNPSLFSSSSNISFPYLLENLIEIKGSNLDDSSQVYYPYAYDWAIEYLGCRQAIPIEVDSQSHQSDFSFSPDLIYQANGGEVSFSDLSDNPQQWRWYFGDGDSSVLQDPIHNYAAAGNYQVLLSSQSEDFCWDATKKELEVLSWSLHLEDRFSDLWQLYPNPSKDVFYIKPKAPLDKNWSWKMYSMTGKLIDQGNLSPGNALAMPIKIIAFSKGIYMLHITDGEQLFVQKMMKD